MVEQRCQSAEYRQDISKEGVIRERREPKIDDGTCALIPC